MKTFIISSLFLIINFFSNAQLLNPILQEQAIQQMEINDLQERLSLSSYYTVKSANQRNLSIAVGIIGSIISTSMITSNIRKGYDFVDRPFGYVLGAGTGITVSLLTISANVNQKEAGLALKFK